MVVQTLGVPSPARRRRRARPREADEGAAATVPLTRITAIAPQPLPGDAAAWLARMRKGAEAREEIVAEALGLARRVLGAWRVAAGEPHRPDPALALALAVRVGYGSADELVEGRWQEALDVPHDDSRRRRRSDALRPHERFAALLAGRDTRLACEELLLRARADVDAERWREAALQMRIGLDALLAERAELAAPGQAEDLAELEARREAIAEAARAALSEPLGDERREDVMATLAVCERVLRRRAAHR